MSAMLRGVLSQKSWRLEEVLVPAAIVWVLASMGVLSLCFPATGAALPGLSTLWGTVLVVQLPIGLLIHRFLRRHGTDWISGFGFRQPLRPALWAWVAGGVASNVVVLLAVNLGVQQLLHRLGGRTDLQAAVLALQGGSTAVKGTIAFTAIVLAPLIEEPLFRGILYQVGRDAGHPRLGLLASSMVFGVVHGNLPTLLPLTLFGAYQCWLYERTGNLLACILTHAGFNAVFVVLTLAGIKG